MNEGLHACIFIFEYGAFYFANFVVPIFCVMRVWKCSQHPSYQQTMDQNEIRFAVLALYLEKEKIDLLF